MGLATTQPAGLSPALMMWLWVCWCRFVFWFAIFITFCQNELGDVSPQEWMLQNTHFVA
jgi:hypothetical protein